MGLFVRESGQGLPPSLLCCPFERGAFASVSMIEDLKVLANKRDVPYQSLLKVFLADRLKKERRRAS